MRFRLGVDAFDGGWGCELSGGVVWDLGDVGGRLWIGLGDGFGEKRCSRIIICEKYTATSARTITFAN